MKIKNLILFLGMTLGFLLFPKISAAAGLYLNPAAGSYAVGSTITVNVRVSTDGDAVNTAEAVLNYSTDTLDLVRVVQGATFYLLAPGSPSKTESSAYFGGGLPSPGYTGGAGALGTLTFRAKAAGPATVSFGASKVLLNDGFGTNALSGTAGARFAINPPGPEPPPALGGPGGPTVSSPSHFSSDGWYAKNDLGLTWTRPDGAYGFSFELDQNPATVPDNILDTTITTNKTYENLKDGQWYFHIKARPQSRGSGFGPTTHFRIQIDTVAPKDLVIKLTQPNQVTFSAVDDISGVDRYDIYLDEQLAQTVATSPYDFSKSSAGQYKVKVIAFDKAGNRTEASATITVEGRAGLGFFQETIAVPVYLLIFLILLNILLLLAVVWLSVRPGRKPRTWPGLDRIRKEIDDSIDEMKLQISQKLQNLSARSYTELSEKEAAIEKEIRSGITKTRRKIDSKISRLNRKR